MARAVDRSSEPALLLLSAPWRLLNWPSLAIGALKSYAVEHGIPTVARHLHFEVACALGIDRYDTIARGFETGEAIFSALLAPNESESILGCEAVRLSRAGDDTLARWVTTSAADELAAIAQGLTADLDIETIRLVGFSVGALQLAASLYFAQLLKRRNPDLRIVFGGAGIIGDVGGRLLAASPQIDYVVDGEGEEAIVALWHDILAGNVEQPDSTPRLWRRNGDGVIFTHHGLPLNLDEAPRPDLSDFFGAADEAGYPVTSTVLPLETSRGCAWEHRGAKDELTGCAFCGLYRNSPNFRRKSLRRVQEEIRAAAENYHALDLSFVDAYLPAGAREPLLDWLAHSGLDLTLFCEMRCDLTDETGELLANAGARRVQLGVESFHSATLARMHKGTAVADNLNSMKICEERGVPYQYNVMVGLPDVPVEEIDETARLLPRLFGFIPPAVARFYLDRGSRMFSDPEAYGLDASAFDATPVDFLPAALARSGVMQSVSTDWCGPSWEPVEEAIDEWRSVYKGARQNSGRGPLWYRDAGDRLIVNDRRNARQVVLVLEGALRDVLLACSRAVATVRLGHLLPHLDADDIDDALREFRAYHLILEDRGRVIALPLNARLPCGRPARSAIGRTTSVVSI